jgi:glyoxylase-like metal-dependent hydrolase (beta-lactamase superfamily II)
VSFERDVAPGIHRIEDAYTNWYLVEEDGALTVVDAGVPTSWSSLVAALNELRRPPQDIRALVLTHAHFDHIGIAERLRTQFDIPVYVHENDVPLAKQPRLYSHERRRLPYFATQVQALPVVASFLRARAFWPSPLGEVRRFRDGTLDVPGRPTVVATPGHTVGHVSLHFADRDVVIAGDAVVTFDPYVAKKGPQIVSRAATADSERALASLDALASTGATTVLPGHGEPWREGAAAIAERARSAPIS